MTGTRPPAALSGGVALLERALGYALGQLHAVTSADLSRPTPCREWDLRGLLIHMDDSLTALQEALDLARVGPAAAAGRAAPAYGPAGSAVSLTGTLRAHAGRLLGALAGAGERLVWVGGFPVPASVVASAGAVDLAVHGWDVGRACGRAQPIPEPLAEEMLQIAPLLVTCADRPALFAPPVPVPRLASASDRLVGYLGRDPATG
jgi:uncharacterized protein (TIGR03086 family)